MVDKYNAKFYIDSKIGEGYTVPSLGVWKNTSEIDFKSLPSSFVLKCNHDSGSVIICENRLPTEFELKQLDKAICKNYYWFSREWPYKNVKPLIFAEKYIECKSSDSGGLHDYKFYCFNGIPQLVCVISDRAQKAKLTFIDLNWNILPFKQRYPNHDIIPKKPLNFDTMLRLSKILSKNIPFLRVDFFEDKNNRLYIGELTFTPSSGLIPFEPEQYDLFYGNLLNIKDN